MLKRVIKFSIDHAALVLVVAAIVLGVAVHQISQTPVDVFPELQAPTVVIMTEAPGLASTEVEQYVTFPIETSVNGIPGVRRVRTTSAIGLSITYIEFDWGTDIYRARQLVSERLDTVREELPPEAHAEMTPITSVTGEIMLLSASSPEGEMSPLEIRSFVQYELRNKLLSIPGVAQVSVIGGKLPEYQVLADQEKLRLYDLAMADLVEATSEAHSNLSAGYLPDVKSRELPIRQTGRVRGVEDVAGTVIKYHDGAPVRIGQVADVQLGPAPRRGTGSFNGKPAVVMTVQKAPGTNTLNVTERIDRMLDDLEPSLPAGLEVNRDAFRQANFIQHSIENVIHALRDAAIIVSIIIILFLLNVRTTIITLTALPLSLTVGLLTVHYMGMTINTMTLGGFAIAVGSLVDDAIIDVENVFRRLNQNAALPEDERKPRLSVVFDASNEIRPAMVFATLIIALVFLPLFFLEGIQGRFFQPLGIAFVVSILASLVVALTVTPAMCRYLLNGRETGNDSGDTVFVRYLKRMYEPVVRGAIRLRWWVLGGAMVVTVCSLSLGSTYGTSFLPKFNEGTFTIGLFATPGTSLEASDRMATAVEKQMLQVEGVKNVTRRTGRAERDEHAEPVSNSEVDVTLKKGADKQEVRKKLTKILQQVPGVTFNVGQPIQHRLSHILSGTPAAIAINVYGDDLAVLRDIARRIERRLKSLDGARDVAANREVMIRSLPVDYRPSDLAANGLTPEAAARQVRNAIYGVRVDEINEGVRRYDLTVRLDRSERDDIEDLKNLVLRGKNGTFVRLNEVADIGPELIPSQITRENAQRKAVVSLNVEDGHNMGHLVERVKKVVDPIVQKHGYTVRYGGQFEAQQTASRTILIFSGVVVLIMLVLLQLATGSFRVAVLVLVNLPLALIGGILAIYLTESPDVIHNTMSLFGLAEGSYTAPVISIASMVGFITLFGIAVRNGILLVNHYSYLRDREDRSIREAVVQGSMERLVPILMTALTAALALIPIILQGEEPGNEILAPLSVVILGGLLSSTLLNLIVIPAGYEGMERLAAAWTEKNGSDAEMDDS